MTSPLRPQMALRRKAVWGPKRTITALLFVALGLTTNLSAASDGGSSNPHSNSGSGESRHSRSGRKATPGAPNSFVKNYKIDDEIKRHSSGSSDSLIRVIVTLQPGAQLPVELKRFAKPNGKLDIINGQALELPYGVVRQLEKHPSV